MRSKRTGFIALLSLLLSVFIIPGIAYGSIDTLVVDDDPAGICWTTPTGGLFTTTFYVSVTRPEADIWTALTFSQVNISQGEPIQNATLCLKFYGGETGESSVTIYGYNEPLGTYIFTSGSELINAPLTSSYVNIDLTNITSTQWVNVSVTEIVREIVNRPWWFQNDNMAFIILGASGPHKTMYDNRGSTDNWARLIVEHGAETEYDYWEPYRGYTIVGYNTSGDYDLSIRDRWLITPIELLGSYNVVPVNITTYDFADIPNGYYAEPWINNTCKEGDRSTEYLYLLSGATHTKEIQLCDAPGFELYGQPGYENNTKAVVLGLGHVWGTAQDAEICLVANIARRAAFYGVDRSTDYPLMGTRLKFWNDTHVKLDTWGYGIDWTAYEYVNEVDYLEEDSIYFIKYTMYQFGGYSIETGKNWDYVYMAWFYHFNQSTGAVTELGENHCWFNSTQGNLYDVYELVETGGGGASYDAYANIYIIPGVPYLGLTGAEVWGYVDENGTFTEVPGASEPGDVKTTLDTLLGDDPLDPAPGTWTDSPISKPMWTRIILVSGLGFIISGGLYFAYQRSIQSLVVALFCILVGVGLLLSLL